MNEFEIYGDLTLMTMTATAEDMYVLANAAGRAKAAQLYMAQILKYHAELHRRGIEWKPL